MKNFFRMMAGVLAIIFLAVQCENENGDEGAKNSITYNNQVFDIHKGILENYGSGNGTANNIDLTLLSNGFTVHVSDGLIDSISGTGNGINFEIFTSGTTGLTVGDYTYDPDSTGNAGTFDYANMVLNFNTSTEQGINLDITGGVINVKRPGMDYEITFNLTASDGKGVTGYFKGPLVFYNYTQDDNSMIRSAKIKRHWWKR